MARDSVREESPGQTADGEPPAGRQTGRAGSGVTRKEGGPFLGPPSLPPSLFGRGAERRGDQ